MADDPLERISRELLFSAFIGAGSGAEEPWILDRIAASLEERLVSKGDYLYREGEPAEHLYFMSEGRIRASREGHPDWVYDGRWVMGTADLLAARARARTAVAEVEVRLFQLRGADWIDLMGDSFETACNALVGSSRGTAAFYSRLAPDGGFDSTSGAEGAQSASTLVGRALLLSRLPLMRGAGVQALTDLARTTTECRLAAGEDLFTPGVAPGRVFIVLTGAVEVYRRDPSVTGRFGPGMVVGEALCLGDPGALWGARAIGPSTLLSFSVEDWFNQMEEHAEMAQGTMASLALERERLQDILAARVGELVLR